MKTEQDYRGRLAWETERRVELTREAIEEELGPFECATDEDARCVLSTHSGAQFVAWLSGPEADARLNVEELADEDPELEHEYRERMREQARALDARADRLRSRGALRDATDVRGAADLAYAVAKGGRA